MSPPTDPHQSRTTSTSGALARVNLLPPEISEAASRPAPRRSVSVSALAAVAVRRSGAVVPRPPRDPSSAAQDDLSSAQATRRAAAGARSSEYAQVPVVYAQDADSAGAARTRP